MEKQNSRQDEFIDDDSLGFKMFLDERFKENAVVPEIKEQSTVSPLQAVYDAIANSK